LGKKRKKKECNPRVHDDVCMYVLYESYGTVTSCFASLQLKEKDDRDKMYTREKKARAMGKKKEQERKRKKKKHVLNDVCTVCGCV